MSETVFNITNKKTAAEWRAEIDAFIVRMDEANPDVSVQARSGIDQVVMELRELFPALNLDTYEGARDALGLVVLMDTWRIAGAESTKAGMTYALCDVVKNKKEQDNG